MPYINQKEYEALCYATDALMNLVENGAEGSVLQDIIKTKKSLYSIIDKVKKESSKRNFQKLVKQEVKRLASK